MCVCACGVWRVCVRACGVCVCVCVCENLEFAELGEPVLEFLLDLVALHHFAVLVRGQLELGHCAQVVNCRSAAARARTRHTRTPRGRHVHTRVGELFDLVGGNATLAVVVGQGSLHRAKRLRQICINK